MSHEFLFDELKSIGWQFEEYQNERDQVWKIEVSNRLSRTSDEFLRFSKSFSVLANQEDNTWFLSFQDYFKEPFEESFAWNDFELQSLESALDDEQREEVENFWNNHLPIMLSVRNGYAHISIVLGGENKGQVVSGNEPDYEDTVIIAKSLSSFFEIYISVLKGEIDDKQLSLFFT